jgi:tetratricopeptide (TPR) repeat protein
MKSWRNNKFTPTWSVALIVISAALSSCLTGYLEEDLKRQQEQLKEQEAELARQRRDLEALGAGKQLSDKSQQDCDRAFRDYFDKAQRSSRRDEQIALYQQGLQLCPDDDVAHYELGRAFVDAGRRGEAEKEFDAALKINPGFAEARRQLDSLRGSR